MTPDDGTLLVVEDEPFLRKAVVASLRFLGFEVTAEQDGTDALRLARQVVQAQLDQLPRGSLHRLQYDALRLMLIS